MKIAVLSDLHIGSGSRAQDLSIGVNENAIDTNYKDKFLSFLLENRIRANYLIIPGDISNTAKNVEFQLASDVIAEIAAILSVEADNVFVVPGNHDSDWTVFDGFAPEEIALRRNDRYLPFTRDAFIFNRILQRGSRHLVRDPFYTIWNYHDILLVGYNSSFHDDPNLAIHNGSFQHETIRFIQEDLNRIVDARQKVKIFVVHHHPISYTDPSFEADYSQMVNSEELLDFLRRNMFDFIIHGHKHAPRFKILKENCGFPIAVLCAGSFSALLDTKWSGIVNNQFHIIDVERRDEETGLLNGLVKSYTYLFHKGWIPSILTNGIPHLMPFGSDALPSQIARNVRPIIEDFFRRKAYIKWRDICEIYNPYFYLPIESVTQVLEILTTEIRFEIHETHKDIILLKEE